MKTYPFIRNSCAGYFKDWLEVYLTDECNGRCSWCIEKDGYKPAYHAPCDVLIDAALGTGRKNICLLGGEPTMYPNIDMMIRVLKANGRNVYLTTNGSKLSGPFVESWLTGLMGINISIHDFYLDTNSGITGVTLLWTNLRSAVDAFHCNGATVRLNCNCIKGHIDSYANILNYINFAKQLRVDSVRFAELKGDKDKFVSLAKIVPQVLSLNEDPFVRGCHHEDTLLGMPVSFKQMCGCQTPCRPRPDNPVQVSNPVLYYDGNIYDGWQKAVRKEDMKKTPETKATKGDVDQELVKLLAAFSEDGVSLAETALKIDRLYREKTVITVDAALKSVASVYKDNGSGCSY